MAEPLWRGDDLTVALAGRAAGRIPDVTSVSFDTREITLGGLFVALHGERDGHDWVGDAFARGAGAAVVSRYIPGVGPQMVVDDTLRALERLGVAARDRSEAKRIAVTGSVGKTSVTQAILAGLTAAGRAHGAVKSFNNHIGVPTTLARMPAAAERAVFEIGMNHPGEIAPLARLVAPHVAVVTTVGPVHVEAFEDGETGIAREKAAIFAGLEPGGVAVVPRDSRWFDDLAAAARGAGASQVLSFGEHAGADARMTGFASAGGPRVSAVIHDEPVEIALRQTGSHWGPNSLAVLLALEATDVGRDTALAALARFEPLSGRGAEVDLSLPDGRIRLIDESYNANPLSVAAALRSLGARAAPGRRVVALTDMLELGEDGPAFHQQIADQAEAADVDLVFCAGPLMKSLWDRLPRQRRGAWAPTAGELIEPLLATLREGDVVMVKGSNGSRAGTIAAALRESAAGGTDG